MSETRYAQVARDLTEGIADGRFPVGSLLPTELELCEHYGASRHTVRAAIRELQELGFVSRRKKVGTRVEATSVSSGYRQSLACGPLREEPNEDRRAGRLPGRLQHAVLLCAAGRP